MLRSLKDVQMFPLAIPEENRELTEFNLIDHVLIKLSETDRFYTKSLEEWNRREMAYQGKWATFQRVMVGEYKRMLTEGAGTKMQQEG